MWVEPEENKELQGPGSEHDVARENRRISIRRRYGGVLAIKEKMSIKKAGGGAAGKGRSHSLLNNF